MNHSRLRTRFVVASLSAALVVAGGATVAAAVRTGTASPASPATGHAEVIAQSVVEFGDGAYEWTATPHTIDAAGTTVGVESPTFLLAGSGSAVHISGSDGVRARLGDGEAAYRPAGSETQATSQGATAASLTALTVGPSDSGTVTPGAGAHDVDVLRDVLATDESFTVTAAIPALVLVTDGAVRDGQGTVLDAGATAMLQGDIALTNTASEPAVVVVAVIGPTLNAAVAPDTTTAASAPSTGTATTSPADDSTPSTAVEPDDTTTTGVSISIVPIPIDPGLLTTTTGPNLEPIHTISPEQAIDSDSDGLTDATEEEIGTDPNDWDTDGDGGGDGAEVDYGSDPNDPDSQCRLCLDQDGDGLTHQEEGEIGTNPQNPDTDFGDGEEIEYGSDPNDPDSVPS